MANPKNIGNQWERDFSYILSEWITGIKDSQICWREASSGARATTRSKTGKQTTNADADIIATDLQYKYWFDKFYIDTKSYKEINLFFNNKSNQKSNDILKQWIKTCKQCSFDKIPLMPVKIRDRKTPDFIMMPYTCVANYESKIDFVIPIRQDIIVDKKLNLIAKRDEVYEFYIILLEEFLELNNYKEFYEDNKEFKNIHYIKE